MKKHLTLLGLILFTLVMGGCAKTYPPAPIGDELVWSSAENRPAWTVDAPNPDSGDQLVFVGQSLYHGTERAARTNAEVDASSKAATFLSHNLKRNYLQTSEGTAQDGQVHNLEVNINENVELSADHLLAKMRAEDWYLEMWRKGGQTFWKAYVKTRLPRARS